MRVVYAECMNVLIMTILPALTELLPIMRTLLIATELMPICGLRFYQFVTRQLCHAKFVMLIMSSLFCHANL